MLQSYENREERAKHHDPAQGRCLFRRMDGFIDTLAQSGAMVGGNGLLPPDTATTIRVKNGTRQVVDGPFADYGPKCWVAMSSLTWPISTRPLTGPRGFPA